MTSKADAKPGIGHNGGPAINDQGGGEVVVGSRLKSFIERVERLEEEKKGLAEDIKDVYAEAKAVGFDTKIMRKQISRRRMTKEKRDEEDHLLDVYELAVKNLNDMME